jgi:hypothetical protein
MSNGISRLSWSWPGTVPVVGGEAFSVSAGSKRFPQRRQTKERSHMLMSFGYSSRLKCELARNTSASRHRLFHAGRRETL